VVIQNIEKNENLGEKSGGSGHLSYNSYNLEEIYPPVQKGNKWEVTFKYSIFTETEFTIEPDNPPYKKTYQKTIFIDEKYEKIKENDKKLIYDSLFEKTELFDAKDIITDIKRKIK
jgi:hypothetical protein